MFFATAALSFVISAAECRLTSGGGSFVFDSDVKTLEWSPILPLSPEPSVSGNLEAALAKDFSTIPEVSHVLTERAEGNLLVWIGISNPDAPDARFKVYDKQMALMDGFPEVTFDFNLIVSQGRNPRELATGAQVVFARNK